MSLTLEHPILDSRDVLIHDRFGRGILFAGRVDPAFELRLELERNILGVSSIKVHEQVSRNFDGFACYVSTGANHRIVGCYGVRTKFRVLDETVSIHTVKILL